ncbi:MAG: M28 family metallopeptidase [Rudaea sp.]|nr:M28 family metallopeptidase [Rudaea sp.]
MRRLLCFCTTALVAACGPQQSTDTAPVAAATRPTATATTPAAATKPTREGHFSPDITAADFAAYVQRLSSDEFEGRKPGSIGERMTTTYLVDQFQSIGLKPGNGTSYLQRVPMVETTLLDGDKITLDVAEGGNVEKFAYRSDTIVGTLQDKPAVELKDSDLVFAGYGVIAPEYQWNDYAGLDVKGKTVVVLVNDPGFGNGDETLFKGKAMTYYGRWTYKFEEAARQGAAGCLIVHETAAAAYPWEVVVNSWSGPQFNLPASEDPEPRMLVAGWLTTDAARRLFAKAGADFDALKKSADLRGFKSSPLAAKLSTHFHNLIRNTSSDNVVALLPGSKRPDEVVVYSAHWDHLGSSFSGADRIFNGAIDNASGVAAMLEIADAFAHQQPPPERSILFLAPTLEEAGLLGSRYYSVHPTVPLTKTVADINMDALQIIGRTHDMVIVGYGQSQMDDYLKDALAAEHRVIVADGESEKGFFYRSDQLNFARKGVPVLYANSGYDKLDGGVAAGRAAIDDYTRNRYHKPGDEYDPNWDLSGVVENIKALYAVGKRLAGESTFPQWNADSEFRAAREATMKGSNKK